MKFNFTNLDIHTLVYAIGETLTQAKTKVKDFISQGNIATGESFTYEVRIREKDKDSSVFLYLTSVTDEVRASGDIKIAKLKHQNFLEIEASEEEYLDMLNGEYKKVIENYLKEHKHKFDFSQIFGLFKHVEDKHYIYFQYR